MNQSSIILNNLKKIDDKFSLTAVYLKLVINGNILTDIMLS
jgi:hypothetical protein